MTYKTSSIGTAIGGLLLIGLGVLFLLGQFVRFDIWHYLWPFFVIGFGLMFFVGMIAGGKEAGGLAIPGSLFTMLGLLFLYQNAFNHWASWAYAWALLAPTSVGIGLMIFGRWSDKPGLYQPGWLLMIIGLTIFLALGAFFELLAGIAGFASPGRVLWPLVLILVGVLLLFGRGFHWLMPPFAPRPDAAPSEQRPAADSRQQAETGADK
jgi:LiaI-LiaF-like transmembrane region